jgi:hypothetical protein
MGRSRYIRVIPIFESLGHQDRLLSELSLRKYAEAQPRWPALARLLDRCGPLLRLTGESNPDPTARIVLACAAIATERALESLWKDAPTAWSFCPTDPATERFVEELLDQIDDSASAGFVHLGGDEAYDVGTGASHSQVLAVGAGSVKSGYLNRVRSHLAAKGTDALLFADLILRQDKASSLDRRFILVDWNYAPDADFRSVDTLTALGYPRVLTQAGLWNWRTFFPDYSRAFPNIARACDAARSRGLLGTSVSSWGDAGAECLPGGNWIGYGYFAACAWEPRSPQRDEFLKRFARTWWGTGSAGRASLMRAVGWVSVTDLGWGSRLDARPISIRMRGSEWCRRMERLRSTMDQPDLGFADAGSSQADDLLACLRLAGSRFRLIAEREIVLDRLSRAPSIAEADSLRDTLGFLASESRALAQDYAAEWLRWNRPAGLEQNLEKLERQRLGLMRLSHRLPGKPAPGGIGEAAPVASDSCATMARGWAASTD